MFEVDFDRRRWSGVDGGDDTAGAVADLAAAFPAVGSQTCRRPADHLIADREQLPADVVVGSTEGAVGPKQCAGAKVERDTFGVVFGHHR